MPACSRMLRLLLRSAVIGSTLGVISSLMVNCSLVEVSCSPFFAVAFGLLFLTSAAMMASQLYMLPNANNRVLLCCFAALNLVAGAVCFLLERDWSHGLSVNGKVPLYALLGSCLAFSVNVSRPRGSRQARRLCGGDACCAARRLCGHRPTPASARQASPSFFCCATVMPSVRVTMLAVRRARQFSSLDLIARSECFSATQLLVSRSLAERRLA